jgi:predicted nicotinamide N-methyase
MSTLPGIAGTTRDWRTFVTANTKILSPPLVPEIRLHLAEESLPIWRKSEEELGAMNVAPPFWAFAWAGGQALARYVLDNADCVSGKRILDLGSGSGLTAIAAMVAGARSAVAADIDEISHAAIVCNAAVNGVAVDAVLADLLGQALPASDVVLVGDLFYERQLADKVLEAVSMARQSGAVILVGDPERSYFPRDRFVQVASYRVPVTRELEDAEIKKTAVWTLPAPT